MVIGINGQNKAHIAVAGGIGMLGDKKPMLVYKMDVLEELKGHGYNTTRLRCDRIYTGLRK